ncbi:MAG: hypothetical protein GX595_07975 [Lentisphaerae bacterium]|nr:hypothetical protein [Lentisphaerota bacterium]
MGIPPKAERRAAQVLRGVEAALGRLLARAGAEVPAETAGDPTMHQVLMTVLRRRATLDWLIDRHSDGRTRPRTRRVLWWALAEGLFLDGLPVPVIVDTAVEDIKAISRGEASFVNALLRRLLSPGREAVLAAVREQSPPWVQLDLGRPLYEAWSARLSPSALAALAGLLQSPAPLVVRRRQGAAGGAATPAGLEAMPAVDWAPSAELYRCLDAGAFFASPAWQAQAFYVQDPSTLLAPALLAVRPGERVADLCSAPGGKAVVLSEALGGSGVLFCVDRSGVRLARVRENLVSVGTVHTLVADARELPPEVAALDAILLDVPCSNTGVVRRRPDVRWHFTAAGRDELAATQAAILAAAASRLRPGGRMVYSTCSLEPQENHDQVAAFLRATPGFVLEDERQLDPDSGHDGAYAARLVRRR